MSYPRYHSYKVTGIPWLQDIPAHWNVVAYKKFVDIQNGSDHKKIEQAEGYPVFGSGGIFAYASDYVYDGESVLLGRKGTIDKPLYVTGRFWTVDTIYWTKINPAMSGKFAFYLALTIPFNYYSTNTALPSMTKGDLGAHLVSCPSLVEQNKIVDFLDTEVEKIDELARAFNGLIGLLKEKRQAVISHAVTKGLDPSVPMKDSGIEWLGQVPSHWEVKSMRYILDAIGDVDHFMPESVEVGVPYLMTGDLKEFVSDVSLKDCKQVSHNDYVELSKRIRSSKGDVIMARYATIGTSMYVDVDFEFLVSYSCVTLKTNHSKVYGLYLFQYMKSDAFLQGVVNQINTNTQANVGIKDLQNVKVAVPPINEQTSITSFLDCETAKIDELITEAQRAIDTLQERRTALISAAVTGKIDVRGLVNAVEEQKCLETA